MTQHQIGNFSGLKPKYFVKNPLTDKIYADPRATRALVALMDQHAVIGGAAAHWGGPSAFAETMSALFGIFSETTGHWRDYYNFVNDAGHCENGLYALHANYGLNNLTINDLKGFRSIESKLTGHGENHLYPEGVLLSNGPLGSSAAQAEGLCLSDKMNKNDRITILAISDGACMEGEAKETFASIPGFSKKGLMNPFVMIISDNNTKLSGRITEDSFDQKPTFESLASLGWEVLHVKDGHELFSLTDIFEKSFVKIKNSDKPLAIVVETIKGKGVKSTEESSSGGHGYPLKAYDEKLPNFIQEIYNNEAPQEFINWATELVQSKPKTTTKEFDLFPSIKKGKVQIGVSSALIKLKNQGLPIVSITSDLAGSTGVADFQKAFPESKIDVGVAESNMVGVAAGFSKNGFIPVVDTFAQFGVTKGNLPLIMANLSNAPIIAVFSHTGYQDAADGASHQATTYFSAVSGIPHTDVFSLSNSDQAEKVLMEEINKFHQDQKNGQMPNSKIFFLGRENFPENFGTELVGHEVISEGKDALIVATGPMIKEALEAKEILKVEGINLSVFENMTVNRPNIRFISELLEKNNHLLITAEDHQLIGGMGSLLCHELLSQGNSFKYLGLGIKNQFGRSAHQASHLYENMGLSANMIAKSIKNFINSR